MTDDIDNELKELEEQLKQLESGSKTSDFSSDSPMKEIKDNIFKFFREILQLKESWKVGNLKDSEIGLTRLSIRSYLELAQYASAEGLDIVSDYFTERAEITASTSMGRKGFLPQLFVTQIKREQKLQEQPKEKTGWFKRNVEEKENE